MGRVVHFDIPIDDPDRAITFYRDVFGWRVERWGDVPYWMLTTGRSGGPGAEGALTLRSEAPEGVVVYMDVDDIDQTLRRVEEAGGDAVGEKSAIPSIGWSAHARDSEGNVIGLFQRDRGVADGAASTGDALARSYEVHSESAPRQHTAVGRAVLSIADIPSWLGQTYESVTAIVDEQGSAIAGPPYARYHPRDDDRFDVEAGFPVSTPIAPDRGVRPSTLPAGPLAVTTHIGPYDQIAPAYEAVDEWIAAHDATPRGEPWEIYLSEPVGDPSTWRTDVLAPYRPA